ncbi:MAG TPA: 2-dehydropantoate 2-reductase [Candidatus Kapabacteria bacterium]|nr:2-dehydropantoate 2-reductase [Candidatus Kapabacteria bacterium]
MPHADWHILGPGAIGSLFAWHLAEAGSSVRLLTRHPGESARLITLDDHTASPHTSATRAFHVDHQDDTPIRRLLVTVKAHQTTAALESIRHRIDSRSLILFLQNGMGTWDCAKTLFPATRWLVGTTTEGAWRAADRHIVHAGRGETWIGSLNPAWTNDAEQLVDTLKNTRFHPGHDAQILQRLWRKLAVNCAINPLTVLFDCRNGELLQKPAALRQMEAVCVEVERVMGAALGGVTVEPLFPLVRTVAEKTGANHSSMLQDYRRGQPTEIEFITGYLVAEGRRLGIDTPENAGILDAIRGLNPHWSGTDCTLP